MGSQSHPAPRGRGCSRVARIGTSPPRRATSASAILARSPSPMASATRQTAIHATAFCESFAPGSLRTAASRPSAELTARCGHGVWSRATTRAASAHVSSSGERCSGGLGGPAPITRRTGAETSGERSGDLASTAVATTSSSSPGSIGGSRKYARVDHEPCASSQDSCSTRRKLGGRDPEAPALLPACSRRIPREATIIASSAADGRTIGPSVTPMRAAHAKAGTWHGPRAQTQPTSASGMTCARSPMEGCNGKPSRPPQAAISSARARAGRAREDEFVAMPSKPSIAPGGNEHAQHHRAHEKPLEHCGAPAWRLGQHVGQREPEEDGAPDSHDRQLGRAAPSTCCPGG